MLAERTKVEASAPVEENLFEGLSLSLPEVPTAPILVPNTKTSFEPLVNVETEAKLTKPIVKQTTMDLDSHKRKTGSLSALYATEIVTSDSRSLYPDLPSLSAGAHTESVDVEDDEPNTINDESASLLPRQPSAAAPILSSSHSQQKNNSDAQLISRTTNANAYSEEEAPELVTDLMRENSRLADEVANLKRILEDQQQHPQSQHHHDAPSMATAHFMDNSSGVMMHTNSRAAVGPAAGAISSVTGVQITDTTKPPEKGVKYVCCGGCRQWLMAPRDAVFVVCSTCQAINNCNLVPKDNTATHNRENDTRALAQRNGNANNNPFWFLDCLSRGLF